MKNLVLIVLFLKLKFLEMIFIWYRGVPEKYTQGFFKFILIWNKILKKVFFFNFKFVYIFSWQLANGNKCRFFFWCHIHTLVWRNFLDIMLKYDFCVRYNHYFSHYYSRQGGLKNLSLWLLLLCCSGDGVSIIARAFL